MNNAIATVLNFLIRRLPQKDQGSCFEKMPQAMADSVKNAPLCGMDPLKNHFSELDFIHPSWITPFIRKLSENDMKLALASLLPETAEAIKASLLLRSIASDITETAKDFFKNWLWQQLTQEIPHLLSIPCLPKSSLSDLLFIRFKDLELLIDLLSMHDLQNELRQIIDTQKLKTIKQNLSKEQLSYLSTIQQGKERVSFKPMNLSSWNGNAEVLKSLLKQRGLNRLAKTISNEHPHFIWYIKRRIHCEEGALFDKLIVKLQNPEAVAALQETLQFLLNTFPKLVFEENV